MSARFVVFILVAMLPASVHAAQTDSVLRAGLQSDVSQYLAARAVPEHISAVSLSVSFPNSASNINVAAGRRQYGGKGAPITASTLYQIGSVTKSFTAAAILQLEAEGKLNIDQTVGTWLPQYPAWKRITLRRLLNMTGDIPTYDDVPSMLAAYAAAPTKDWTGRELVAVVYPKLRPNAGWLYSNTGYVLLQMIVERASGNSYAAEIRRRFLNNTAVGLTSTYYEQDVYPAAIGDRMTGGYFFSTDADNAALAPLLGKDMRPLSLSWAQGAGGIVSTPEDVTRWCRALYEGSVLPAKQRREMMTLVSQTSGKPITASTAHKQHGFGLGIGSMFMPGMGHVWFYEGMTLGYRMTYVYLPKQNVVFAVGLNSQPNKKQDKVGRLMTAVYRRLHAAGKV
ncbi:MAG: serine hydrolase domain-containing protein [Candidatus Velthaea sp.]